MSRFLIRLLGAAPPGGDLVPDAELLRRYAATRDPAAFELLVRRHANAVWAACARVLRNDADADDAFQTTFLVLAKKAAAVRGACAGAWLHRVAVNAALKLKANGRRQPASESAAAGALASHQPADAGRSPDDLDAVHEELAQLPERYRLPVVLCDLEGQSRTEAARALGWPLGNVNGRLSRARDLLRDRLARRGFAPVVLVVTVAPPWVVQATAAVGAGSVAASPAVSSLAEGVLTAMRTAKLKVAAVLTVGLLGVAGFGAVIARSGQPEPPTAGVQPEKQPPAKPPEGPFTAFPEIKRPDRPKGVGYLEALAKACPNVLGGPITIDPADDTYRRLLKEQLNQGKKEMQWVSTQLDIGRFTPAEYHTHLTRLRDLRAVATELWANDPQTLVAWLQEFVILAKDAEAFTKARVDAGTDPVQELPLVIRHRLAAEAALWKAKNPPKR